MATEYSCILKELLGDGLVRLGGVERREGGVGRLIEGGWVGRADGKNLQILDLHRLASLQNSSANSIAATKRKLLHINLLRWKS